MGHTFRAPRLLLPVAETIARKDTRREAWIPVTITDDGCVRANEYHGSAHVNGLCHADGLVVVPRGVASIEKGTFVNVRPI